MRQENTMAAETAIKFRNDKQFWKYAALKKITSQAELARAMNVNRSTISRTLSGESLGIDFVNAVLRAFPELTFEDLFELAPIPKQRTGDEEPGAVPA